MKPTSDYIYQPQQNHKIKIEIIQNIMLSLKEVEFQFWEQFSQFEEDEDSKYFAAIYFQVLSLDCFVNTDDADYHSMRNSGRNLSHKQNRLKNNDMSLYGQSKDFFSVVACHSCGMVLKPQALNDHFEKRHSLDSLSNLDEQMRPIVPFEPFYEPKAKRQKNGNIQKVQAISESQSLSESPALILKKAQNFFKANSVMNQQSPAPVVVAEKPNIPRIKVTLKKSGHGKGNWAVVTA